MSCTWIWIVNDFSNIIYNLRHEKKLFYYKNIYYKYIVNELETTRNACKQMSNVSNCQRFDSSPLLVLYTFRFLFFLQNLPLVKILFLDLKNM